MKKIAITGGIGSGKSTISDYFIKRGFEVHDSDVVISNLYEKPSKFFLNLLLNCGIENIIKNNKIDKTIIAKNIFINKKFKISLEKHLHNQVRIEREIFVKKQLKMKKKIVFFDIPLLLENSLEKKFDLVLCILSSKTKRVKRIKRKKKYSKETLNRIFKNQTSDKERRLRSDIIITNNKTKKDFIFKAEKVLLDILK